jgi:ABC-type Mn2+/Zn2+ transport system ATPase subunit
VLVREIGQPYIPSVPSLALYHGKNTIYQTDGPWLYPLLGLEKWLAENPVDTSDLLIYDKIIGRASALLITRLGFRSVRTDLISDLAVMAFESNGIAWKATERTDRILCATETLLEHTTDPEEAHRLIVARAQAARAGQSKQSILTVENLNVFRGGRHVLSAVDLELAPGDRVLITGENGAGKTTLLRAVLGLVPFGAGSVTFNGNQIGSQQWRRERHKMAYVRQAERHVTLPISAAEVVGIGAPHIQGRGRHAVREAAIKALDLTGVGHLDRRPFAELSGGEQRRVSLARAFAQAPLLLVLDEPTAGLDQDSRSTLLGLIELAAGERGIAVLMVTHDPFDHALGGWRVLHLQDGRLGPAVPLPAVASPVGPEM